MGEYLNNNVKLILILALNLENFIYLFFTIKSEVKT